VSARARARVSVGVRECGGGGWPSAAADIQARFNNVNNPSERRRRSARDGNWVILGLFACWAESAASAVAGARFLEPFRTRGRTPHRTRCRVCGVLL